MIGFEFLKNFDSPYKAESIYPDACQQGRKRRR